MPLRHTVAHLRRVNLGLIQLSNNVQRLGRRLPANSTQRAQLKKFRVMWQWKIDASRLSLGKILDFAPGNSHVTQSSTSTNPQTPNHVRKPRGLINPVGKLEAWLFGTATEDDIKALSAQISKLSQEQMSARQLLLAREGVL